MKDKKRSTFVGDKIKLTVFGASHDKFIGGTLSGVPVGETVDMQQLSCLLARRKPVFGFSTSRKEADVPFVKSGITDGVTDGKPIKFVFQNLDVNKKDYNFNNTPRPSHADYVAVSKYGADYDLCGGGKFSGRLTAPMTFAGGIALQLLAKSGVRVHAFISSVGNVCGKSYQDVDVSGFDFSAVDEKFPVIAESDKQKMLAEIENAEKHGDSVGGTISCVVTGVPVGTGEYMFDSLESKISSLLFGVPAVKGIEFGDGFAIAKMKGSEANDSFAYVGGKVVTTTNRNGGINGGIANGMPITFRVAVKPTPSISLEQQTVDLATGKNTTIKIGGRHDACIVPRAVAVVEAVTALAIYDSIGG